MSGPPREPPSVFEVARWTREARAGSQAAFARLYHRYLPLVHGLLLARFRPALADELSQECFEIAFARLSQLQEDASFGAWIATIARRMRATPQRELPASAMQEPVASDSGPEEHAEALQLLARVQALPEAYRETLMLRLVEGLSGPEIAELTGLTPASVRVNLHRGMEKLREGLGETRARPLAGEGT